MRRQRPISQLWPTLALLAALGAAHCGNTDVAPETAFAVEADGTTVRLRRAALGRPFLLRSQVAEVGEAAADALWPLPVAVMPRVVRFRVHDDRVALYSIDRAACAHDGDGRERLLETFALLPAPAEWVAFRWHGGLQSLSLAPSVADGGPPSAPETQLQLLLATTPQASFLRTASVAAGTLHLVQDSRLAPEVAAAVGLPAPLVLHVTSSVAPYVPRPGFVPLPVGDGPGVGYFAVPADGDVEGRMLAMRWGSGAGAPLRVALQPGFAAAEATAVGEGVGYWNRVAGRVLLEVVPADAGEVAVRIWPTPAGALAGLAQVEADPFTGAILAAEVFIGVAGGAAAADGGAAVAAPGGRATVGGAGGAGVPGVPGGLGARAAGAVAACGLDGPWWSAEEPGPAGGIRRLGLVPACRMAARGGGVETVAGGVPAGTAAAPELLQDTLRLVAAHEIGHVLGLRHNFAGSLGSALGAMATGEAVAAYLRGELPGGAAVSSTVMDYLDGGDSALLGAAVRSVALPYDRMALGWGYGGDFGQGESCCSAVGDGAVGGSAGGCSGDIVGGSVAGSVAGATLHSDGCVAGATQPRFATQPYCSDTAASRNVLGCARFDRGGAPLLARRAQLRSPRELARALVAAPPGPMVPGMTAEEAAAAAWFGPEVTQHLGVWAETVALLRGDAEVLSYLVDRDAAGGAAAASRAAPQASVGGGTEPAEGIAATGTLQRALREAGGLHGLLAAAQPLDPEGWPDAGWLDTALHAWQRGGRPFGPVETPPDASTAARLAALHEVAPQVEDLLLGSLWWALGPMASAAPLRAAVVQDSGLAALGAAIEGTLLARGEDGLPQYGIRTRRAAAAVLSYGNVDDPAWTRALAEQLRAALWARLHQLEATRERAGLGDAGYREQGELWQLLVVLGG